MDKKILVWKIKNFPHLLRGVPDMIMGMVRPVGRLYIDVIRSDGSIEKLGLVSTRVVTTAGVNYIVDAFQNTAEVENFKYHAMGTTNTAENSSDTAMATEVETRATGSQTEGSSANIYKTVGTITATAPRAVVEHGIFSASSGPTLLDRSVFSTINLATNDSIQFTYELTFPAGS